MNKFLSKRLGCFIKKERERQKISIRVFAKDVLVSHTQLVNIESGKVYPSEDLLLSIMDELCIKEDIRRQLADAEQIKEKLSLFFDSFYTQDHEKINLIIQEIIEYEESINNNLFEIDFQVYKLVYYFKKSFHFKVDIASSLLFLPLKLLVISALWKTLFQNAQTIGNFTYQEMVFYYFLIAVLEFAINPFAITCYSVMQDIRMGKLDIYLTKPMNYLIFQYFLHLKNMFIVVFTLFFAMLLLNVSLFMCLFTVSSILFSSIVVYLIFLILGELTFYLDNIFAVRDILRLIIKLCSGSLIPISYYPSFLRKIIDYLPFDLMYSQPILMILNKLNDVPSLFILQKQGYGLQFYL